MGIGQQLDMEDSHGASADNTAQLWVTATGQPHGNPLRHKGIVNSVAFSPDGKLIATSSTDNTAQIWVVATGQPHGNPLRHKGAVNSVAFSPDGEWLASGSSDGIVRIWLLPEMPTDLREMELRTWTTVGARLNERGNAEGILWQEWQRLKGEIRELESRPKIQKTKSSFAEPVLSLAATPEGRLYVSTASGVFRSHDQGRNWIKMTLEQTNIRSLAVFGSRSWQVPPGVGVEDIYSI